MLHALIVFAAEAAATEESSKAPFYIAGAVLAVWAVAVGAVGISRHESWPSEGAARGIMGISALLVIASMATAVVYG